MMENHNYNNACTEISVILNYLNIEDYNKIPDEFIEVIEANKNPEYKFELIEGIELKDQNLLEETRVLLFKIFNDYLATQIQKEKIKILQKKQIEELNKEKQKKYSVDDLFKRKKK